MSSVTDCERGNEREESRAKRGKQNQVKSHDWDGLQAGLNILQHVVIYTTNVDFVS